MYSDRFLVGQGAAVIYWKGYDCPRHRQSTICAYYNDCTEPSSDYNLLLSVFWEQIATTRICRNGTAIVQKRIGFLSHLPYSRWVIIISLFGCMLLKWIRWLIRPMPFPEPDFSWKENLRSPTSVDSFGVSDALPLELESPSFGARWLGVRYLYAS